MSRFPPRNPPDNAFSWSCCNCVCNFNLSTLYQVAILWSCLFVCLSVCWQICFYLKLSICLLQLKALRSPPLSLALHLLTSQFQPEVKRVTKVIGSHTDTQTQKHRHPHTNTQTPSHKHTYTHTHRHTDTLTHRYPPNSMCWIEKAHLSRYSFFFLLLSWAEIWKYEFKREWLQRNFKSWCFSACEEKFNQKKRQRA